MDASEREYYELLAIGIDGKWKDVRFVRDENNNDVYICRHMDHNPGDDETHWHIWKLTYTGSYLDRVEGDLVGSFNGKGDLDWA